MVAAVSLWVDAAVGARASRWVEYSSTNFVVYSDRRPQEAQALLADFERFRTTTLVLTGLPASAEDTRAQIFLFSRRADYQAVQPDSQIAGFYLETPVGPRMVVGAEARLQDTSLVLFHEYVHLLVRARSPLRYPLWYDEGFADLLAASTVEPKQVVVGLVHPWRKQDLDRDGPLPVAELLRPPAEGDARYWSRYYASAWLLMHYLQLGHLNGEADARARVPALLRALNAGTAPEEALKTHFLMSAESLDERIRAYRNKRFWLGYRLEVPEFKDPIRRRSLTANESAFLLGDLAFRSGQVASALDFLQRIDATQPTAARPLSLRALAEHHQGRRELALHVLGLALGKDVEDATVHANAAQVLWRDLQQRPEEARPAILARVAEHANRALAIDASNLEAGRLLARVYREQGDTPWALQVLRKLYSHHATDVRLNLELGVILSQSAEPDSAIPFLERVEAWDHSPQRRAQARQLLQAFDAREALVAELEDDYIKPVQITPHRHARGMD